MKRSLDGLYPKGLLLPVLLVSLSGALSPGRGQGPVPLPATEQVDVFAWKKLHSGPKLRDTYDILRGELAGLPVGPDDETCLESDHEPASYTDTANPDAGAVWFYLLRGRNVCGVGGYGVDSESDDRLTSACP